MNDINQDAVRHGERTQRSVKEYIPLLNFDITYGFSHGCTVNTSCFLDESCFLILQKNIRILK